MKNFKIRIFLCALLSLATLALTLTPPKAQAQWANGYAPITLIGGGTNNIAAGSSGVATTNVYTNLTMVVNRSEYFTLGVNYNFTAAPVGATPTIVLRLQRSFDGSHWESQFGGSGPGATGFHVFTINGATNDCTAMTNLTAAGTAFYRIVAIENTNSAPVTNLTVVYGVKR